MLLSQTAEYSLRAMCWLAALPPGEAMRAKDLAEAADIPPHYLSKLLRRLVVRGLLTSQKGHGGGFALARDPAKIQYADVLDAVDAGPTVTRCAFGWGECDERHPCPMHNSWSAMHDAFESWAREHTLADVLEAQTRVDRR